MVCYFRALSNISHLAGIGRVPDMKPYLNIVHASLAMAAKRYATHMFTDSVGQQQRYTKAKWQQGTVGQTEMWLQ